MTENEIKELINKESANADAIIQEEGESYTDFLKRKANLLGWGNGKDAVTAGKL